MYSPTIDISFYANPVLEDANKLHKRKGFFVWILEFFLTRLINRLKKEINSFIFMIDGVISHINELDSKHLVEVHKDIQRVIDAMSKVDEIYQDIQYMEDEEIKNGMRYLLKSLYKLEARLEVRISKENKQISDNKNPEIISEKHLFAQLGHQSIARTLQQGR